jgi:hypothetical protein
LNGLVHGVLDGTGGGAGEFDEFIDWVFHVCFFRVLKKDDKKLSRAIYL